MSVRVDTCSYVEGVRYWCPSPVPPIALRNQGRKGVAPSRGASGLPLVSGPVSGPGSWTFLRLSVCLLGYLGFTPTPTLHRTGPVWTGPGVGPRQDSRRTDSPRRGSFFPEEGGDGGGREGPGKRWGGTGFNRGTSDSSPTGQGSRGTEPPWVRRRRDDDDETPWWSGGRFRRGESKGERKECGRDDLCVPRVAPAEVVSCAGEGVA